MEELNSDMYEIEDVLCLCVHEEPYRDITDLLEELPRLHGSSFVKQLKLIAAHREFYPVHGEVGISCTGGEQDADYENLLNAARKAVEHGYRVFILPNPKGIRTADFIFERKGVYKMFDLKTISGKNSVGNRLKDSIDQTNSVLLNLVCDYKVRDLAIEIKRYFEMSDKASEVLIFTGRKILSVKRNTATSKGFLKMMMNSFRK